MQTIVLIRDLFWRPWVGCWGEATAFSSWWTVLNIRKIAIWSTRKISGYYISNHDSAIYLHSHGMISLACNHLQLNPVGTQNCFPLFRLPRGGAGLSTIITQFTQFRASGQGEEKGNWGRRNALVKRLHIQFKAISPKKGDSQFCSSALATSSRCSFKVHLWREVHLSQRIQLTTHTPSETNLLKLKASCWPNGLVFSPANLGLNDTSRKCVSPDPKTDDLAAPVMSNALSHKSASLTSESPSTWISDHLALSIKTCLKQPKKALHEKATKRWQPKIFVPVFEYWDTVSLSGC